MPRLLAIVLVAVVVGPIVPAGARHEPSQVSAHATGMHGEPGGVGILGSSGNNQIAVRNPAPDTVVVTDQVGATAETECQTSFPSGFSCGCQSVDATSVSCNTPYGTDVGVGLVGGDDAIRVFDPMVLRASGGSGADRMTGNARGDFLEGGIGQDRLSGRQGQDRLFTHRGHDSAYGGAGDDFLWVLDRDRDRVIDCGPGNDRAFIDRKLDPEPLRCERVRFGPIRR